jgi:hypothetical protein
MISLRMARAYAAGDEPIPLSTALALRLSRY